MKNARGVLVTCLAGLVVAGLAMAQEGAPVVIQRAGGAGGAGAMWGGMSQSENEGMRVGMLLDQILEDQDLTQKVGLTDEQVKTLRTAISDSKKEQIKLKADMEIASVEQADEMTKTNIDEKVVMTIVGKIGNLKTQLAKSVIKELIIVKKTVTPEQIKKIKEVAREMHKQRMMNEGPKEKKKEDAKERRKDAGKEDKSGDQKEQGAPPSEDVKP